MTLYIPIGLFNLYPGSFTFEDTNEALFVERGTINKEIYTFNKEDYVAGELFQLQYNIRSLQTLVSMGIPLLSFIIVGFLFQFSKVFKNMPGMASSRKRALLLIIFSIIIILFWTGTFIDRIDSLTTQIEQLEKAKHE